MKTIGMLMIVLSALAVGLNEARKLNERYKTLEQIVLMIKKIRIELNYTATPTKALIKTLSLDSDLSSLRFLDGCASSFGECPFNELWNKQLYLNPPAVDAHNLSLLNSFGNSLGATDLDGQNNICDLFEEKFTAKLKALGDDKSKRNKLYIVGSLLLGIGFSIIII